MTRCLSIAIAAAILAVVSGANAQPASSPQTSDTKGKICRMEQQCHWENFKKICTWVKVCR